MQQIIKKTDQSRGGSLIRLTLLTFSLLACQAALKAQVKVVLDNFFNHEVHAKTGKVFHYTWDDKDNSGFSDWGAMFEQKGAKLSMLETAPDKKNLKNADVYIIADPDTKAESPAPNFIAKKDIQSIDSWVKAGGVLLLMANDSGNCEFDHLNHLATTFGMRFNEVSIMHVTGGNWDMGAITDLPAGPLFDGVHKIYLKEVSTLTLSGDAKPLLSYKNNVLMAESKVGKGYVLAITDPWIYNEYISHRHLPDSFDNEKAAENLTNYLIGLSSTARK